MAAMRPQHLREVDLNLLVTLQALLEERHVTRAAKRCFLSQPAMSRAFERLKDMLGDQLLIRSGRTYERTARGERLLRELQTLLPRIESIVRGQEFEPSRSDEGFRIALTDHASVILMPSLVKRLRTEAPGIKIETSPWRTQAFEDLSTGRIDLALSAETSPPGLQNEVLFGLDFICVVGVHQKQRSPRLTLSQYLPLPHVLVETWTAQQTLVERPLAQLGAKRRVVLTVPYFVPAIFAVAYTDMIVTVPGKLAKIVGPIPGIRYAQPPKELKPFPYFMTWHPRLSLEPAHVWFREQFRQISQTIGRKQ
jgi:DNA-binding transcriptional LysR family regulator